jgi:hypothetical protein
MHACTQYLQIKLQLNEYQSAQKRFGLVLRVDQLCFWSALLLVCFAWRARFGDTWSQAAILAAFLCTSG